MNKPSVAFINQPKILNHPEDQHLNSIAVFCGSSSGTEAIYTLTASALGRKLAKESITLVYGGANIGLMGAVANGALSHGGNVIGILPAFLQSKEIAHQDLTQLIIVDTMHDRKIQMHERCDGIIALPGGFGTLEELFEILTWGQLGLHQMPIGILNINGFYDDLLRLLETMVQKGFLKDIHQQMLLISDDVDDLLHLMRSYTPPHTSKWITKDAI